MTLNLAPVSTSAPTLSALKQVLTTIQADSCPHFYNFHCHTTYSDGKLEPEELMAQAVQIGLQGMAISDHHTVEGYLVAQQWLQEYQNTHNTPVPLLWTGLEVTANLGGVEVHILGYGFDIAHPAMELYIQGIAPGLLLTANSSKPEGEDAHAEAVIAAIQEAGGLVILAHPARYRRPAAELIAIAAELGIDGVETYYAYNNPNPWQPSPKQTQEVKALSDRYGLLNSCGTDTHGLNLLQRL